MPTADTITKWVAGIAGGLFLAMQGWNNEETGRTREDVNRAIKEIHELHQPLLDAVERQKEILEVLKQHNGN